ncbi:MAG: hypothetical protein JRG73_20585 [Deltaproteobacteria bacterium]|nr:hypothetical protein [Deltaproteobacteria bacterium]
MNRTWMCRWSRSFDALHRIPWLLEKEPPSLNTFLDKARPHSGRLRLAAQTLAGKALSGKGPEEAGYLIATESPGQAAPGKWRSLLQHDYPLFKPEGHLKMPF